jgi:hypothetical protein
MSKIPEVKAMIKLFAQNCEKNGNRIALLLEGHAGGGKSQAVQQVAEEMGYTYVDLRLAEQEPGDLVGIPRSKDGVTVWDRPSWIPADPDTKLMLALEEVNRAPEDVRQAIFQALTEYRIHTHELPKVTQIVSLINPCNDIYHVSELCPAFLSRHYRMTLDPDVNDWLTYMHEIGADDRVIQFIGVHNELMIKPKEGSDPWPSPRSWKYLSDALKVVTSDEMLFDLASGFVGKDAGVAFRRFCDKEYKKPVTGKEILSDYDKVKGKLKEQRNDEMNVTVTDLCNLLASSKTKLMKKQFDNLKEFLIGKHQNGVDKDGNPKMEYDLKAEWKSNIVLKLPSDRLSELSAITELVDIIAEVLAKTNKQQK